MEPDKQNNSTSGEVDPDWEKLKEIDEESPDDILARITGGEDYDIDDDTDRVIRPADSGHYVHPEQPLGPTLADTSEKKLPHILKQHIESKGQFGPFKLIENLGEGGMGLVYKVQNIHSREISAIKIIVGNNDTTQDELIKRLGVEAAGLSRTRHRNLVRCKHADDVTLNIRGNKVQVPYLLMEYIEGYSLAHKLVVEEKRPTYLQALHIAHKVASALVPVHEADFVHRDIKPGNILIEEGTMRVVLVDLNIAKTKAQDIEGNITTKLELKGALGSLPYMAPEQLLRTVAPEFMSQEMRAAFAPTYDFPIDPRTDIFSLGVVLEELITGDVLTPKSGDVDADELAKAVMHRKFKPTGKPCDKVLKKMVQIDPDHRYETMRECRDAIGELYEAARRPDPSRMKDLPHINKITQHAYEMKEDKILKEYGPLLLDGSEYNVFSGATTMGKPKREVDVKVHGPRAGQDMYVVGRQPATCDIHLDLTKYDASRNHFRLIREYHRDEQQKETIEWSIEDVSSNGTWLNDEKLDRGIPTKIDDGDSISIRNTDTKKEYHFVFVPPEKIKKKGGLGTDSQLVLDGL